MVYTDKLPPFQEPYGTRISTEMRKTAHKHLYRAKLFAEYFYHIRPI